MGQITRLLRTLLAECFMNLAFYCLPKGSYNQYLFSKGMVDYYEALQARATVDTITKKGINIVQVNDTVN